MANQLSNLKKVRGWKKQIRRLNSWQDKHIEFDLDYFNTYHRDYIKYKNNLTPVCGVGSVEYAALN